MKLDTGVFDLDGKPVMDRPGEDASPTTIGKLVVHALLATLPGDERMSAEQKVRCALLAQRIHGQSEIDTLTAEDITLIKARAGSAFTQLVVMRVWEAIDPASVRSN